MIIKIEMPPPDKNRDEKIIEVFNKMMMDELLEQKNKSQHVVMNT